MEDETLDALTALYSTYPTSKNVDYSAFMRDFQPVESYPNYFVPQQGLLQNTPTLDTLSDLDIMQQRPQSLLDMINLYPTLENDFQRSFAVNPDTYNMNVYEPLPYDENYWKSKVAGTGGTGGSDIDLSDLATVATGLGVITSGIDGTDTTIETTDESGSTGVDSTIDLGTTTINTIDYDPNTTDNTIEIGTTDTNLLTDESSSTTDNTVEIGSTETSLLTSDGDSESGNQTIETTVGGVPSGSSFTNKNETDNTVEIDEDIDTSIKVDTNISANDATLLIDELLSNNVITASEYEKLNQTIETSTTGFDISNNLVTGLNTIQSVKDLGGATRILGGDVNTSSFLRPADQSITSNVSLDGTVDLSTNLGQVGFAPTGVPAYNSFTSNGQTFYQVYDDGRLMWTKVTTDPIVGRTTLVEVSDPRNVFEKGFDAASQGISKILNTTLLEGTGGTGYLGNLTNVNVGEAISGVGMALSLADAIDDANVGNVLGTVAGATGLGLFGTGAQTVAAPVLGQVALIASLAGLGQPDPSNMTGFGGTDLASGENVSFGMQGDKFSEDNVNAAGNIASVMGNVVNNITSSFGLNAQGDILAQTGDRDPLNITFGDQESTQTLDDRLNYSSETGDITNSNDDITRLYYTGRDGNDGATLADNLVKGTALLSLKAKANGEDSINIADITLPARSADDVKNTYLSQGFDETAADALTSAARSASGATSELLGGLLLANTTNEANYLTNTERTSLLEQGFTDEQLDTILYGTTEESITAVNLLNTNEENNEENI